MIDFLRALPVHPFVLVVALLVVGTAINRLLRIRMETTRVRLEVAWRRWRPGPMQADEREAFEETLDSVFGKRRLNRNGN